MGENIAVTESVKVGTVLLVLFNVIIYKYTV